MPRQTPRLILASASPARLSTLRAAGLAPEVVVSGVDEDGVTGSPGEMATELARLKATAVAATEGAQGAYVIGCDSLLELDGRALGKPHDATEATQRWQAMRGRSAILHTGHCLLTPDGAEQTRLASTTVHFADPSDAEIDAYVAHGEPLAVAGAFTLDGLGGAFVAGVEGDPHNVVGISTPLLRLMLRDAGVSWTDLWHAPPSTPT